MTARLPDFFVVGHQKSGTTAIYEMLRLHPEVFLPTTKEPQFFSTDLHARPRAGTPPPAGSPRTLEAYLELFAPAREDQRVGDASPQYLRSRAAAANIAEVRPDARIIAILREPADFVRSFHHQLVHANQETERDLRTAVGLEAARRAGRSIPRRAYQPKALQYCEHVRYVEQLERFHAAFGADQVMVLIYDDFRKDNLAVLRRILDFLAVDESLPLAAIETKPLKHVRSMTLHRLAGAARHAHRNPGAGGAVERALGALSALPARSQTLRELAARATYSGPNVSDGAFLEELRVRFKPEVVALSEYLGRDLTALWGYDRIG